MYYLVMDFGGSSVKCAVMTESADIIELFNLESRADSYIQWIERFVPVFNHYNDKYGIKGIAISTCGAVDVDSGVISGSSALPYIHGFDVRALYQERFQVPVELENDACCAALAESWLGAGKETSHFCTLVIGSGIGGAIVKANQVQKGHNLHGGEFGFMIAEYKDEKPLIFGNLASTKALVVAVAEAIALPSDKLNGIDVFNMYTKGNETISPIVEKWFRYLAAGIYNIQYSVDPELILLGGAVSRQKNFCSKINEKLDELMSDLPFSKIRPVIGVAQFGNNANLIGALKHFLIRQGS
ncbi:ROK family protein [Vibrio sp. TH_r3]|uniref:ROK family protein n=1 Tax=Vibrio sp. TH_r3 TaxID=3082084 RepID=UPI0029549924|nr:ROK family protein [Vibrio sp. TH_r3]MDV7105087.1 ROK family protein [Vibrio sp. TH_r3]